MDHAMIPFTKRIALLALAFSLLFSAAPAARGAVFQQGEGVTLTNPEALTFPLCESAEYSHVGIATYHNGVYAHVVSTEDGMAQVRVGGRWDDMDGVIGYVPESFLRFADDALIAGVSLPVAEILPVDGRESVILCMAPHESDQEIGLLPVGAQVEVMGEMLSCYHVQFGDAVGFLPKDALRMTEKRAAFGYGIARDGFAVAEISEDTYNDTWEAPPLYIFPNEESDMDWWIYNGETVSLLNDLGKWAQVRTSGGAIGFAKTEGLTMYPYADMRADAAVSYAAGSYTVGADIAPGLYTLDIPEGGSGGIEAMGQGTGAYHNYSAQDAATFALYLTAPTTVEIEGQAVLSPMDIDAQPASALDWRYSGNGRFFSGVQLQAHSVFMYEIRLLPGESIGYYTITNLSQETGKTIRPERHYLTLGETQYVTLDAGEFIELRNCEMVGRRGNG